MSFKDRLSNILKVSEDEYYDDPQTDEYEQEEEEEEEEYEAPRSPRAFREQKSEQNKVVSINTTARLQVVITKPKSLEDACSVADSLNAKKTVIVNLEAVNGDTERRILDFLGGATYANRAAMRQIANGTFIITPSNVDVNGDLLSELGNNGIVFNK